VELNFGTNQIQKLPDDIALLANLEVNSHIKNDPFISTLMRLGLDPVE